MCGTIGKESTTITGPGTIFVVDVGKLIAPLSMRSYMAWHSEAQ